MCNKILWLDHGQQIAFTDEVELYCNAYEEFLQTKKLPKTREDVEALSEAFRKRKQAEREAAEQKEIQKLQTELEKGTKDEVIQAAVNIIRKNCPATPPLTLCALNAVKWTRGGHPPPIIDFYQNPKQFCA